jgi:glycerophosphoryl diester phosphodiesterase
MSVKGKNEAMRGIRWQAHQNSNSEMPENTMAALRYAWELGGIPELDIRQTADGIIIGMHDATPKRTTTVPEEDQDKLISDLTFAQIQAWDAGAKFGEQFRGEKVPSLEQVLAVLAEHSEREVYLDFKQADLESLAALIRQYGVARQIIFAHNDHENCKTVKRLVPEIRTMLWIPGRVPEATVRKFEEARQTGFDSLNIIQIHLADAETNDAWRYKVSRGFLQEALRQLGEAGLELEVLPFQFDQSSLFELLDMGIRRFAVDEPRVFVETLGRYFES